MLEALLTVVATAAVAFIGWLVLKVLDLERKLVELEARVQAREDDCKNHHEWMDDIAKTLEKHGEDLAFIRGRMERDA